MSLPAPRIRLRVTPRIPPSPGILQIGTVVSGPVASATITGTAQPQTLNLVLPTGAPLSPLIINSSGAVTIGDEFDSVILNKFVASPTTINLPAVADRQGRPLVIADWAGNAGDITLIPSGSETIMGLNSAILASGGQGIGTAASITLYASIDLNGWITG